MALTKLLQAKFIQRFYENVDDIKDMKSAYERTESEYIEQYGARMYSDYNSFKVVKYLHMKKKRKNKPKQ
jgi:hypothetical protein